MGVGNRTEASASRTQAQSTAAPQCWDPEGTGNVPGPPPHWGHPHEPPTALSTALKQSQPLSAGSHPCRWKPSHYPDKDAELCTSTTGGHTQEPGTQRTPRPSGNGAGLAWRPPAQPPCATATQECYGGSQLLLLFNSRPCLKHHPPPTEISLTAQTNAPISPAKHPSPCNASMHSQSTGMPLKRTFLSLPGATKSKSLPVTIPGPCN